MFRIKYLDQIKQIGENSPVSGSVVNSVLNHCNRPQSEDQRPDFCEVWTSVKGKHMSQMSLFDCDYTRFAGVMPAVRAAMRRAAGAPDSVGRKGLVDKINLITTEAEIRLTGGQGTSISKDTLDKWLSPSDTSHPPSVLAVLVFCRACDNFEALRVIVQAVGMDLMTPEDRRLRDYAEADLKMKEARKRKRRLEEGL